MGKPMRASEFPPAPKNDAQNGTTLSGETKISDSKKPNLPKEGSIDIDPSLKSVFVEPQTIEDPNTGEQFPLDSPMGIALFEEKEKQAASSRIRKKNETLEKKFDELTAQADAASARANKKQIKEFNKQFEKTLKQRAANNDVELTGEELDELTIEPATPPPIPTRAKRKITPKGTVQTTEHVLKSEKATHSKDDEALPKNMQEMTAEIKAAMETDEPAKENIIIDPTYQAEIDQKEEGKKFVSSEQLQDLEKLKVKVTKEKAVVELEPIDISSQEEENQDIEEAKDTKGPKVGLLGSHILSSKKAWARAAEATKEQAPVPQAVQETPQPKKAKKKLGFWARLTGKSKPSVVTVPETKIAASPVDNTPTSQVEQPESADAEITRMEGILREVGLTSQDFETIKTLTNYKAILSMADNANEFRSQLQAEIDHTTNPNKIDALGKIKTKVETYLTKKTGKTYDPAYIAKAQTRQKGRRGSRNQNPSPGFAKKV